MKFNPELIYHLVFDLFYKTIKNKRLKDQVRYDLINTWYIRSMNLIYLDYFSRANKNFFL